MPTLFISYKRKTASVAPLMQVLRQAHYRLWYDRDEIHLGDADWQTRIDQGLEQCDGVILNITPAACASEPVRYEVRKALELGKPLFPVMLEVTDYDLAIRDLGLPERQHIEELYDESKWDSQVERLLRDLETHGLVVTRHERRQQRDRNNPSYVLHQTYLKRLAERIGTLNLAQINPDNAQGIELERVYVDSPTGLSLSAEMRDWQVLDWWVPQEARIGDDLVVKPEWRVGKPLKRKPQELGYETAPFETLVGGLDVRIAAHREENPEEKPDENTWRAWHNGAKENIINLHLNHLVAARDRLVILGAPGSGKSTFVKYLALCLAGSGLDDWARDANITSLDNWPHGALTPVYVELRRFVASAHFPADVKTPATADHLWAYIQHELLGEALATYADDLRYDLEHGHAVLILDGLDEVPYPEGKLKQRQGQLIGLAQSLNTRYATSRIIVASRPYAYEGWTLPGFQSVTITKFKDNHRTALASRLYRTAGLDENAAKEKARALNQQLQQIDDELKDRPLFVTLMATIYLSGDSEGLPTRRGALYRESILLLLDRWTQSKPGAPSLIEILGDRSLNDLYARLAALAYDVHNTYGDQPGTPEIDEILLYQHLRPLGRSIAVELIPYLSENAGVLVCPGQDGEKDVFHFAHRTFQEYLAAAHLMTVCTKADSFGLVRDLIMSKPQVWRVPCVLAGDVLTDTDRRSNLWGLLDDLLDDEITKGMAANDLRWWTVWLASVILQEQKLLESDKLRRSEKAIGNQLRDWLLALILTSQVLPPAERALCGRVLSLVGDPRPGIGNTHFTVVEKDVEVPQITWCDIPAPPNGIFIMGADDQGVNPRREVELSYSFKMAKYLVTYQQFQTFADSGEYNLTEWWVGFLTEYQPQQLNKQNNPYANHPRDRVSWYQAVAFSRWATAKYRAAGLIDHTVEIRLPTEVEWEYAARDSDERKYPYGPDFDAIKANTGETALGQTSAVGLFPDGASPYGVQDMSGNVWEWCLNKYDNPDHLLVGDSGDFRVLRGGSFHNSLDGATASSRYYDPPHNLSHSFGVRLVCAAPIASLTSESEQQ